LQYVRKIKESLEPSSGKKEQISMRRISVKAHIQSLLPIYFGPFLMCAWLFEEGREVLKFGSSLKPNHH